MYDDDPSPLYTEICRERNFTPIDDLDALRRFLQWGLRFIIQEPNYRHR
jgi:hypothetical protein